MSFISFDEPAPSTFVDFDAPAPKDKPAKPASRTWGEAASDTGRGLMSGGAGVVKGFGDLYGLATGDMDNTASRLGRDAQESWESGQSDTLKAKRKERKAAIDAADGIVGQAWEAFKGTVTDPVLAADALASNIATMVPGMAVGRAAQGASLASGLANASKLGPASMAAREAAAKAAASFGTSAAVGVGSLQQGADVSGSVYADAMKKPDAVWLSNPDFVKQLEATDRSEQAVQALKHEFALKAARTTLPAAAAISVVANKHLPGADMVERALVGGAARETIKAGTKYGIPKAIAKSALGNTVEEGLEEGGGAFAGNVAKRSFVDPNQAFGEGVGENIGMGMAGGLLMGGVGGAMQRPAVTPADIAKATTVDEAIQLAQASIAAPAPVAPTYNVGDITSEIRRLEQASQTATETTQPAALENIASVATDSVAKPAQQGEPATVWFGRKGDGYQAVGDATAALQSRVKVAPELDWRIEQMPSGKYRLAGYQFDANRPIAQGNATSGEIPNGIGERPSQAGASNPTAQIGREIQAGSSESPKSTLNPSGTATITGDPAAIRKTLIDAGVTAFLPSKTGVLVSRGQAAAAIEAVANVQNAAPGANVQAEAAPSQAPETAGIDVAGQVPAGTQSASAGVEAAGVAPEQLGRNSVPLSQGGKPFKTKLAADAERKRQPSMRTVRVAGGFVLAEKTPAQLAAQEKAAKRLRNPSTGAGPISAHGFIAGEGGLSKETMADMGFDRNIRVGNRTLFAGQGHGLTLEQATEKLIQDGYLREGASHSDTVRLVRQSVQSPQYTLDGWEQIAQAEKNTRYEDHLAAQQDAELDPFRPDDADILQAVGYDQASPEMQAEFRALVELAEANGIDTESIREDAARLTVDKTEQAYYEAATTALQEAIARSNGDGRALPGQESGARAAEAKTGGNPGVAPTPKQQTTADAGVSASGTQTLKLNPDGTLLAPADAADALRAGGITRTMNGKNGILVGKTQAQRAMEILNGNSIIPGDGKSQPTPDKPEQLSKPKQKDNAADAAKPAEQAAADLKAALADLADLLTKGTRMNMLPEQEVKLLPVLTRLFDAAFRLGHIKFKDAARFALEQIRTALGQDVADQITIDHLQGAYIGMSGKYRSQGADSAREVVGVESKEEINAATPQERTDAASPRETVERDSPVATAEPAVGQTVPAERRPATKSAGGDGAQAASPGRGRQDDPGVSAGGPVVVGERGDQRLPGGNPAAALESGPTGALFGEGGGDSGIRGVPPDAITASQVASASHAGNAELKRRAEQRAANAVPVKPGLENIRATLPYLLEGQQQDVQTAETRFAKPEGYGMLFTNGTGTGKTFSGLGIIKRFERQGKTNTLIVAPDEKIASDWIKAGETLQLGITKLADTKTAGKGIVVTTYANLGANDALASRDWDLVVADEAHTLMQEASGKPTLYLNALRAITHHPDGNGTRHTMLHRPLIDRYNAAEKQLRELSDSRSKSSDSQQRIQLAEKIRVLEATVKPMRLEYNRTLDEVAAEVKARQGKTRARAVFLSATPFAYEKTIDWANGYLFDYGRPSESSGYNEPNPRQRFFMTHLGYRMRFGKLTEPEATVDRGLMQRQFNGWMKKEGVLSGRMLDVPADYDRRFVLVNSKIGTRIDEALDWLNDNSYGDDKIEGMSDVRSAVDDSFDYLSRRYLLEAIKAQEVVPIVKQHMALGRKVVVFHDYNKGGGFNPFDVPATQPTGPEKESAKRAADYKQAAAQFREKFADLVQADFAAMRSPIDTFKAAFDKDLLLINGLEKKGDVLRAYTQFQNEDSGPLVALVQADKNKGWSGHDTTGKHQRVLINLGQPTQPTRSIQQEGRIYRTGQVSNAIFRYLNTGTNWERWAFATTIASRASTAENLGMGEMARALKDAYIAAFEQSAYFPPGHAGEGTGGKELDRAANNALTEYDRARAFYFGTEKKTSKTKAQEGTDYFATPEPVGYKMVQWAGVRGGEDVLEPSGGHGAIARWFPELAKRTTIEPSSALRARLAMVFDGKIIEGTFEDHNAVNKYDAIVMNPPFGTGGKTAIEHLAKAAGHLRTGGRIVALLPTGPSADKRLDDFLSGDNKRTDDLNMLVDVAMPSATFERAGTKVATRIIVLQKGGEPGQTRKLDLTDAQDINELFDRLEGINVEARGETGREAGRDATETSGPPVVAARAPRAAATPSTIPAIVEVTTSKGKVLRGVIRADLSKEQAMAIDPYTWIPTGPDGKRMAGYFIREKHLVAPPEPLAASEQEKAAEQIRRADLSYTTTKRLAAAYRGEAYRGAIENYKTLRATLEKAASGGVDSDLATDVLERFDLSIDNLARRGSGLTAPTPSDVLAQEKRAKDGERAEREASQAAERKANADAQRNEFTLTGSNRAADVAAAGGQKPMFSRGSEAQTEIQALSQISQASDFFSLPKSTAKDIETITTDNARELSVRRLGQGGGRTDYTFTFKSGQTARMVVRAQNPYGPSTYGYELQDGEMVNIVQERPGLNAEAADGKDDVWIDVSLLSGGENGQSIYNIAATYAHNNGKVFIGDPAGLSDEALRRRTENMLNSALKFGTTEHLAPHPRQTSGDASLGVKPLLWDYEDSVGNINRMIDSVLSNAENAGYVPIATDYIPASAGFRQDVDSAKDDVDQTRQGPGVRGGSDVTPGRGRFVDAMGQPVEREAFDGSAQLPGNREAQVGGRTLARLALFTSLLRRAGSASAQARGQGGGDGVLVGLAKLVRELSSPDRAGRIFYARSGPSQRGTGDSGADGKPTGLSEIDGLRAVSAFHKQGLRKLRMVRTMEQLPESGKARIKSEGVTGVRGMYDPATDTTYLVRENLTSMEEAMFVGLHEAFHRGLRKSFGADVGRILTMIDLGNKNVAQAVTQYMKTHGIGRQEAIEEVLADMAGQGTAGDLKGWDKLLAFLRDAIGKIASKLGVNVKFTDQQITDFVAGVRRAGMQDEVQIESGTTASMANNDVVGNQGGRSADSSPALPKEMSDRGVTMFDGLRTKEGNVIAQAFVNAFKSEPLETEAIDWMGEPAKPRNYYERFKAASSSDKLQETVSNALESFRDGESITPSKALFIADLIQLSDAIQGAKEKIYLLMPDGFKNSDVAREDFGSVSQKANFDPAEPYVGVFRRTKGERNERRLSGHDPANSAKRIEELNLDLHPDVQSTAVSSSDVAERFLKDPIALIRQMVELTGFVRDSNEASYSTFIKNYSPELLAKERAIEAKRLSDYVKHFTEQTILNAKLGKEPNEPTAPTSDGATNQTDTPAFKAWFGDSVVTDTGKAGGKPLVMYHGTSQSQGGEAFTVFDTYASKYGLMGQGGYFTADPAVASSYTSKGRGGTPTVYQAYLSSKNPVDMDARADAAAWKKQFPDAAYFHEEGDTNESWYRAAEDSLIDQMLPAYEGAEIMQDGLRAMGFDGVTHMGGGRIDRDSVRHRVFVVFDPEQIKSAIGNRGTFDPNSPDIRFSFAGRNAATADAHSLETAERRLKNGVRPEQVRKDTGWFKGADGKMRFEINDKDAKLIVKTGNYVDVAVAQNTAGAWGVVKLGSLLEHPALFAAYPSLKEMDVTLKSYGGNGGSYNRGDSSIVLNGAIAERAIATSNDGPFPVSQDEADTINADEAKLGQWKLLDKNSTLSVLLHEIQHGIQTIEGFASGGSVSQFGEKYHRLAGEAEARNVQTRQTFTDEERALMPAYTTQDVPDSDVIVVFNGTEMQSAPTPANAANNPDIRFSRTTAPTWDSPEPTRMDKLIFEMQDNRIDLKRVQEAITSIGKTIDEKFDARLAETNYPGRVEARTKTFLKTEYTPIKQAMAKNGVTQTELADYLIARHAPERNAQVRKVNPDLQDGGAGTNSQGVLMTDAAAAAHLAALSPGKRMLLGMLARKVDAITTGTRKLLVAEGLEKADTVAAWEGAYKNYVPLFKDEAEHAHPQGMGFSVKGGSSKRSTGSAKEVTNVLAHVLMQREAAITRAEKNRVGLALYGLALSNPNPAFWTTIRPNAAKAEIAKQLTAMGVDTAVAEAGMDGVPTIRTVDPLTNKVVDRPNPMYKSLPGAITLKVDGEDRVLMLNEKDPRALRMALSLKNQDRLLDYDLAGSMVGKTTRWLAAVNTQYNPAFGLVNLVRDILGGAVNLGSTQLRGKSMLVLAQVPAAMQGIARELAGGGQQSEWSRLWKQFQDDGGKTGYRDMFMMAEDRAKEMQREIDKATAGKLTPGKMAHGVLDVLDGFNTTLENAVRVSAYKTALDGGMTRPEAARLARELTVDFNRKGRAGRELGPLYAFLNASVQGTARTVQTLKGPTGAKIIAGGLALGAIQALMLAAAGYDDDEIPEFVKTRAFIIPLPRDDAGGKQYISIPMPLGLNVIPNTGRVLTELSLNGGKDMGKHVFKAVNEIAGSFNPMGGGSIIKLDDDGQIDFLRSLGRNLAPTVADPLLEMTWNRNFADKLIEREARGQSDSRPGFQRAKESTQRSTTGQAYLGISKAINTMTGGTDYEKGVASPSPEMIRYLAQTAGGGVLRELEKTVDSSVRAINGEDVKPTGMFVVGRFFGEVDDNQVQMIRYYDQAGKLNRLQSSLGAARSAGDGEAMERMFKEHPELAFAKAQDKVQSTLSKLNKLAVTTVNDQDGIKAIDDARVETIRSFNEAIRKMEKANSPPTLGQSLRGLFKPEDTLAP